MIKEQLTNEMTSIRKLMLSCPWQNKAFYADWLSQTYHFVCYSTRTLHSAAGACSYNDQKLFSFFNSHIPEESNHEKICLTDLKNLGFSLQDEKLVTQQIYRTAFKGIYETHSVFEIGYMTYLENLAIEIGPLIIKPLNQYYGEKCTKFLSVHISEDEDHVEKTLKLIEKLPDTQQTIISDAISLTAIAYTQMINNIIIMHSQEKSEAVA